MLFGVQIGSAPAARQTAVRPCSAPAIKSSSSLSTMSLSPRLSSPAAPMSALPLPPHVDDGPRRSPIFMDDFQQLVSDAFGLKQPRLSLSVAPASSPLAGTRIAVTPDDRTIRSYFDHDVDDAPRRPSKTSSRRSSLRPRSQSFGAYDAQRTTPVPHPAHVNPRARPSVARRVIQTIRTRASALGLRPAVESAPPYATAFPSAPPYLPVPVSRAPTSAATTRPNSTLLSPTDLPQYSFPPRPAQDVNSTTATSHQEVDLSEARHRSSSIPVDFLQVPEFSASHTATPGHSQCPSPAPRRASVQHASVTPKRSRRPRTPSLPASPGQLHAHARLSPLPKSRSFNVLSLPGRNHPRPAPAVESVSPARLCSSSLGFEYGDSDRDSRCPSPFTNPRSPPPVPTSPKSFTSRTTQGDEDMLEVPAYVFERRGSATSDMSQSSGKSTRTLAERISKALPQISKLRSRSKLNLSVITNKSAESTPSSCNTSSAWSGSLPPTPNAPSFYGMSRRGSAYEAENGIISMDRVLTPESDPFKKASVEISLERENTPRPLESGELSPRESRARAERNSRQKMARKRSMGGHSGHSYTNSGDTITPLTGGTTPLAPSPEDLDVVERSSFVFPLPTSSSAYLEWSPVSLRSSAALPAASDPRAHVVALTHSPASSKVSWEFVRLPPPGPPPTIPLPPSPTSSGGSSPRLRRRKSWSSLRAAINVSNGSTRRRPSGDRPPSPFPLKSAFSSCTSFADSASIASGRVSLASRIPSERSSEDVARSELPVRGSAGWVRGPRFAGGRGQGSGQITNFKGPASSRMYSDLDQMVTQSMKHRLEPSRSRFTFPDQLAQIPALVCRPILRSSQSDSALRTRAQVQDGMNRGALPLPRPNKTTDQVYERLQWEATINQSTTSFYSARTSMDSDASSEFSFGPLEDLTCRL